MMILSEWWKSSILRIRAEGTVIEPRRLHHIVRRNLGQYGKHEMNDVHSNMNW